MHVAAWTARIVVILLAVVLAADWIRAATLPSCAASGGGECYPWGAEGPVAVDWRYARRANYLVTGGILIGLLCASLVTSMILKAPRWRLIAALAGPLAVAVQLVALFPADR